MMLVINKIENRIEYCVHYNLIKHHTSQSYVNIMLVFGSLLSLAGAYTISRSSYYIIKTFRAKQHYKKNIYPTMPDIIDKCVIHHTLSNETFQHIILRQKIVTLIDASNNVVKGSIIDYRTRRTIENNIPYMFFNYATKTPYAIIPNNQLWWPQNKTFSNVISLPKHGAIEYLKVKYDRDISSIPLTSQLVDIVTYAYDKDLYMFGYCVEGKFIVEAIGSDLSMFNQIFSQSENVLVLISGLIILCIGIIVVIVWFMGIIRGEYDEPLLL